ncbi:MAG: hypothetical protein AB8B82_16930 [Roseovarius sp.]
MSKSSKSLVALGLVVMVAACGGQTQEEQYVAPQPEPISVEPTYTGKI